MVKRFTTKKYDCYPVIVDNEEDEELTLDSVAEKLNTFVWDERMLSEEREHLLKRIQWALDKKNELHDKNDMLWRVILVLIFIVLVESLYLLGVI